MAIKIFIEMEKKQLRIFITLNQPNFYTFEISILYSYEQ